MSWFVEHWIASSLLVIYVSVLFHNAYVGNKAATGVGVYYVGISCILSSNEVSKGFSCHGFSVAHTIVTL